MSSSLIPPPLPGGGALLCLPGALPEAPAGLLGPGPGHHGAAAGGASFAGLLRRTPAPARARPEAAVAEGALGPGDALHVTSRHVAQLRPPTAFSGVDPAAPLVIAAPASTGAVAPAAPAAAPPAAAPSLEELLPALVRRIAWSGDARRGAVRLEMGAGPLEGGTLLVHAAGGRVDVTLTAPVGTGAADAAAWADRIARRLEARGIEVGAIDVR